MHYLIIKTEGHMALYNLLYTKYHNTFNTDSDKLMHDLITKTEGHMAYNIL